MELSLVNKILRQMDGEDPFSVPLPPDDAEREDDLLELITDGNIWTQDRSKPDHDEHGRPQMWFKLRDDLAERQRAASAR